MKIRFIIPILLLIVIVSCTNTQPQKTSPEEHALRIVSLVPSFTNEIVELGLKDNIVGATSYCEISKENKDLIVGSVVDINEEKIMLLKPDVVFASTLVKEESIKILKNNGINVKYLGKMESFDDLCSQFLELSQILHKEDFAKNYINKAKNRLDSLMNLVPSIENKPTVCFQLGANPIAIVIPNTFMNDFISLANAINVFCDLDKIIVNREAVLLRNPDYIIISSMGNIGEQEKLEWEKYTELKAVKNKHIFIVESASTPTIHNFVNNFEDIVQRMYFNSVAGE